MSMHSSPNIEKRGPGRPPSSKKVVSVDYSGPLSVFPSLLPQTAIVKRTSGRPRKSPPVVQQRSSSLHSTPIKRSRGRPRKNGPPASSIQPENQNSEIEVSLSKKRGRPRKNATVVETLKEEEEVDDDEVEIGDDIKTKLLKLQSTVREAVHQLKPHVISLSNPDATAALNSLEVLVPGSP